ncbi:MAG: hypothetical protein QG675_634 [Patescibacteria group bacterium]|jgi:GNAT superfamily N-acetyltransferase|nr:hypothetical protein [Patescibacteria group bacterium]
MNVTVREVSGEERDVAIQLEKRIFEEEGYPYDYGRFDAQSRVFAAFTEDGVCIGALRLITQSPLLPPSLSECTVWDVNEWMNMEKSFEELGTQAVEKEFRHSGVGVELIRACYRSGRLRGLTAMSVITEPETAAFLNDHLHFACRQIGEVGFHGWDCAPFIHVFSEVEQKLALKDPASYAWFTEGIPDDLLAAPRN